MVALYTQNIPENDALVFISLLSVKPKQAGQPQKIAATKYFNNKWVVLYNLQSIFTYIISF
jgi:hypothetical protein